MYRCVECGIKVENIYVKRLSYDQINKCVS
ncbi:hypothetical protein H312_00385 [Anncaliia algerae PRA339]|uniref:Uncharacterized protein n=1 Tax=Anncaliia algerae PRA339 TaxID=1288291 RepID=A0A059F4L1_9MICR|nr:hypothetical protein H312_00385 [Anncaliia algerae PRA339]